MDKYCLEDYTSNYMYRLNLYNHQKRIGEIRNRKNVFLPKINSNKNMTKAKRNKSNLQKIDEENFIIFKRLLAIDHRLPAVSGNQYLSKKYVKEKKKEREEFNKLENMLFSLRKSKDKKMLLWENSKKEKYEPYNNSSNAMEKSVNSSDGNSSITKIKKTES